MTQRSGGKYEPQETFHLKDLLQKEV